MVITNRPLVCFLLLILSPFFVIFHVQLGNASSLINILPVHLDRQMLESCKIDRIYQFGDSVADTGNLIHEFPIGELGPCDILPYGQDFYNHQPTGRCSNGLLMIDYFALAAGLPLLNPYKNANASFTHGVNFAVVGATALSSHRLEALNFTPSSDTNSSLDVQLHWMAMHFNSICQNNCAEKLRHALFFIGGIGANDYNYGYYTKSTEEMNSLVPEVVQAIKNTARSVIHLGGVQLVIPGEFPVGCFPFFLTSFETDDALAYDENGCLRCRNSHAEYHNHLLQQAIKELKQEFPNVSIVYGDYYNAFLWLVQNARELGFDQESTQKACCGVGGKYNYDRSKECGNPEATVCGVPDARISWDGSHFTQATSMKIVEWLLTNIIPQLHCSANFISAGLSSS